MIKDQRQLWRTEKNKGTFKQLRTSKNDKYYKRIYGHGPIKVHYGWKC